MKKVLVTGGTGFIGSNLIKALSKEKLKIFSLDDYSSGTRENEIENVTYIEGDISSISQINEEIDICFHLAAKSLVQESFQNVRQSFKVNVDGTLNVLEWAKDNNVKILFAGSASRHNDPTSSPYAMTKFIGEETCKLYKKNFNVNVEIARFYNVYGPNERIDDKDGNVIGIWRSKLVKGLPLPIVGDGNQKRDFIHVEDIADGLIKLAFSNKKSIDAWELGTGLQYSVNDLYKFFKDRFINIDCIRIDDQPGNYRNSFRKHDQMTVQLNWEPKDRLQDYIQNLD
jgi:UDP-glucose 4-epimerase